MADVPVPEVAEVTFRYFSNQGPQMQNSLYFSADAAWSTLQLETLAEQCSDAWGNHIAPIVTNQMALTRVLVRDIGTTPYGFPVEFAPAGGHVGEVVGDPAPYFACAVVQFRAGGADIPRESYIRHTGLVEAQTHANSLIAGQPTAIRDAWLSLIGDIEASIGPVGKEHVIISRYTMEGPPGEKVLTPRDPGISAEVASYAVRTLLGTATSRKGSGA